ncbi:MAG: aminoacyl-histidine dipeptidase [Ignavibacteriales bacterium]|nr:aminoacyl-histidine dipeptidase [Ignavibacteriales bacterium]
MTNTLQNLQPQLVWKYFSEIAQVPRPSKHEERISQYILDTAKKLGLKAKQDKFMNVVVHKPATKGKENVKSICLQGHLDMVCEKNADKVHDFMKDPIELVVKGNVLMANGTTLGADNGIAVATMLAIAEDKSLEHGALELLFTIDEETGLTGAANLQKGFVQSKTMMNLDSEEEGALYVGCSGGKDTTGTWKIIWEKVPNTFVGFSLEVKGLKGGHSGLEIDKGRGNAVKIINRVLIKLSALGSRLSAIKGGDKRNAIPRECSATILVPKKSVSDVQKIVSEMNTTIKAELSTVEPDLQISVSEIPPSKGKSKTRLVEKKEKLKALKKVAQRKLLQTISALPHGVMKMSADIPGLVETSTNVASIVTMEKEILIATSQRSSVASEILEIVETVENIFLLGGASVKHSDGYPGWKPDMNSAILKTAKETYKQLYKKEPAVKAIHAGLECGIIGERFPGMDMVSFGPTMEGVHSPDEKLYIDTVDKFWKFLLAILKNVN